MVRMVRMLACRLVGKSCPVGTTSHDDIVRYVCTYLATSR